MLVCRKISWKSLKYFKDFGRAFCSFIKNSAKIMINRIDFIFDSYFETSQKSGEQVRRYGNDAIDVNRIADDVEMPKQESPSWVAKNNKGIGSQ